MKPCFAIIQVCIPLFRFFLSTLSDSQPKPYALHPKSFSSSSRSCLSDSQPCTRPPMRMRSALSHPPSTLFALQTWQRVYFACAFYPGRAQEECLGLCEVHAQCFIDMYDTACVYFRRCGGLHAHDVGSKVCMRLARVGWQNGQDGGPH
jgi:hypothetical protein